MVRAENVDQSVEAPLALVEMIGDVGCEIGPGAVLAHDHAVFLVAEIGRPKPGGAVLLVQHAAFLEHGQCLVDAMALRQALLGKPAIEGDAELRQVVLDVVANAVERLLPDAIEAVFTEQFLRAGDQRADVRFLVALRRVRRNTVEHRGGVRDIDVVGIDRGGDVADVVAAVAGRGKRNGRAASFQPAQPDADAEDVHLAAGVVHVVLAVNRVADGFEQVAHRRAVRRMPAVANVQRAGGVRGHELEQDAGRRLGACRP